MCKAPAAGEHFLRVVITTELGPRITDWRGDGWRDVAELERGVGECIAISTSRARRRARKIQTL